MILEYTALFIALVCLYWGIIKMHRERTRAILAAAAPPVPNGFYPKGLPVRPIQKEGIVFGSREYDNYAHSVNQWNILRETQTEVQWRAHYAEKMMEELY